MKKQTIQNLTKKEIKFILSNILTELETLLYVGNVDFTGLETQEGYKVCETIHNRLEFPIQKLKEVLTE